MIKKFRLIVFIPFILVGGCSSEKDETTPDQTKKESPFDSQLQALEKAKGVEQILQSGFEKRGKALEGNSE